MTNRTSCRIFMATLALTGVFIGSAQAQDLKLVQVQVQIDRTSVKGYVGDAIHVVLQVGFAWTTSRFRVRKKDGPAVGWPKMASRKTLLLYLATARALLNYPTVSPIIFPGGLYRHTSR